MQSGYTIVEVTLFLAVSSLLVLIAILGTGNTIRASRFTDSSRSMHAFVQKKYDDILNGVNTRLGQERCNAGSVDTGGSQAPGTSNCLLLGKLITIEPGQSTLQAFDIVGTEPTLPDYNKADEALIYDFRPTVVRTVGVDTYQIPWQAQITGSKRLVDSRAVDAFAMIRSPKSTRIVSYTYKEPGSSYNLYSLINPATPANANNISKPTNFCLQSADGFGVQSKLVITNGQGQAAIQLDFNATAGDCDGA